MSTKFKQYYDQETLNEAGGTIRDKLQAKAEGLPGAIVKGAVGLAGNAVKGIAKGAGHVVKTGAKLIGKQLKKSLNKPKASKVARFKPIDASKYRQIDYKLDKDLDHDKTMVKGAYSAKDFDGSSSTVNIPANEKVVEVRTYVLDQLGGKLASKTKGIVSSDNEVYLVHTVDDKNIDHFYAGATQGGADIVKKVTKKDFDAQAMSGFGYTEPEKEVKPKAVKEPKTTEPAKEEPKKVEDFVIGFKENGKGGIDLLVPIGKLNYIKSKYSNLISKSDAKDILNFRYDGQVLNTNPKLVSFSIPDTVFDSDNFQIPEFNSSVYTSVPKILKLANNSKLPFERVDTSIKLKGNDTPTDVIGFRPIGLAEEFIRTYKEKE